MLISGAARLATPHRRAAISALIGLLAVAGMRVGEAIGLDHDDLHRDSDVLLVRQGKFGKSRRLPLHPSTARALLGYLKRADRPQAADGTRALLLSQRGTRLRYCHVQQTFAALREKTGLRARGDARPRLHDIRHSFAVWTLLDAYRKDGAPGARIAALSTYLGHVDPAKTYWYLQAAPELLALAAARLERHSQGADR